MYEREQLIEKLGIQAWPVDKQEEVLEVATYKIGEATTSQLSEQQFNEYQAIVNDDHSVIDAWLETHVPDYKNSPIYQDLEAGYATDPEQNNPAKLFASVAWIQVNVPNVHELIDKALDEYRQELAA